MKYRKKPVVVEAHRLAKFAVMPKWLCEAWDSGVVHLHPAGNDLVLIETLEGTMEANMGDWIIKGIKGELYPCKPDIFEATYEPVGTSDESPG
ncbi:MAG TPA: hypothetical protein VNA25_22850 [Phycisphaerae bacterium]|nr:hypothetical protein [Phycisphaerae bacterium]